MDYDKIISSKIYNNNNNNNNTTQGYNYQPDTSSPDSSGVDYFFNQESPYKYPKLIICDDSKRINQSADVIQKYLDVINDASGNRFNIRNLNSSAGILQAGYSANIDLDSHLKNINYYTDKCYYDNWKHAPHTQSPNNSLKQNANILAPDYTSVGRHYQQCLSSTSNTNSNMCWNTPPSDFNLDSPDIRKRYDFGKSYNKFITPNCLNSTQKQEFPKGSTPPLENLLSIPGHGRTNNNLFDSINRGTQHDYYKFFDSNPCITYPNQRLFNNITKRSMLPNTHFRNTHPIYHS